MIFAALAGNLLIWQEQQLLKILLEQHSTVVTHCCYCPTALSLRMSDTCTDMHRRAYHHCCTELASAFMLQVFGTNPYPWQQDVIAHLGCIRIPDSGLHPGAVLLV